MEEACCCLCLPALHALLEMPVKREGERRQRAEGREEVTKFKPMVSRRYDSHEVNCNRISDMHMEPAQKN